MPDSKFKKGSLCSLFWCTSVFEVQVTYGYAVQIRCFLGSDLSLLSFLWPALKMILPDIYLIRFSNSLVSLWTYLLTTKAEHKRIPVCYESKVRHQSSTKTGRVKRLGAKMSSGKLQMRISGTEKKKGFQTKFPLLCWRTGPQIGFCPGQSSWLPRFSFWLALGK